jgi:hypothetical protein
MTFPGSHRSLGFLLFGNTVTAVVLTYILGHHLKDPVFEASPEFQRPPRVSTSVPAGGLLGCLSKVSLLVLSLTSAQEENMGAIESPRLLHVIKCDCTSLVLK